MFSAVDLAEIRAAIDDAQSKFPDPESPDFIFSSCLNVIKLLLGAEWCEKNVLRPKTCEVADQWFRTDYKPLNISVWTSRVSYLADTLFRLGFSSCFADVVKRFEKRSAEPKTCFLEAFVIETYLKPASIVSVVKESGTKRQDFDFKVHYQGITVFVEVTSKNSNVITTSSFYNLLRRKHSQLPDNGPSVLHVYLDVAQVDSLETQARINEAIAEFFRRNKRVVRLNIFSDRIVRTNGAEFVSLISNTSFPHPEPRFYAPWTMFADGRPPIKFEALKALSYSTPQVVKDALLPFAKADRLSLPKWYLGL